MSAYADLRRRTDDSLCFPGAFMFEDFIKKKQRVKIMSKGQDSKKSSKKKPAKTMKEKKAAKRDKKNKTKNSGVLNQ